MEARFVSPRENFMLRDNGFDKFLTHSDLVAVYIDGQNRGRVVVPAGAVVRRPHPRRARAKLVRQQMRRDGAISPRDQVHIYADLLWREGVPAWRAALEKRLLAIGGRLRYGRRYAETPPNVN